MNINRRKFILSSVGGVLLGYFGLAKEVLAKKIKYRPSEYQGFYFDEGNKETVGYITTMTIRDTEYPANLRVSNPLDSKGKKLEVVGVLTAISFYGTAKPIAFQMRVPNRSRQLAGRQTYGDEMLALIKNPWIEFGFVIYQYDADTKKHYKSFHSGSYTLKGTIKGRHDELWFDIDPSPSEVAPSPRNYGISLSIMPDTHAQDLHVAESPDASTIEKWWGPR